MSHAPYKHARRLRILLSRRASSFALLSAFAAVLVCASGAWLVRGAAVARGANQDLAKLNRFVQTGNTPAMKMFRAGRDMIENEEWAKAAEAFRRFIETYPRDNDVDAALYWYAYALKRQGNTKEAAKALKRLIKEHERSGWREEADAMLTELAPALGQPKIIDDALDTENEELKIIALQSLFESNPERALAFVTDWLKPNSTASRRMKESAVSLLGAHGGKQAVPILLDIARNQPDAKLRQTAIHRLGEAGGETVMDELMRIYSADPDANIKRQVLHALAEMDGARAAAKLLEIAQNAGEDIELRKTAIARLGERDGAFDNLARIYDADRSLEIRKRLMNAFAESDDPRAVSKLLEVARAGDNPELRKFALRRLGEKNSDAVLDDLMRIYQTERDADVKRTILHAFSDMNSPRAKAKLYEIARNPAENADLRRTVINRIGEHHNDAQTVELLISLYDAEQNLDIKRALLNALGESDQKAALRKLMQVARSDASLDLRRHAIRQIGESKDPDALRFLEEILKP
ncbi:MAG TPA: HEAT repeat domain-containing protein [Pyrinomonadaceae bacterium]|jgi:HEAT repeat protein|nr:HEAT repeat domain-containing protein [Pyrinomonadaceae bacterium]